MLGWFEKFWSYDFSLPFIRLKTSVKNDMPKTLVETTPIVPTRELARKMQINPPLSFINRHGPMFLHYNTQQPTYSTDIAPNYLQPSNHL